MVADFIKDDILIRFFADLVKIILMNKSALSLAISNVKKHYFFNLAPACTVALFYFYLFTCLELRMLPCQSAALSTDLHITVLR